MAGMMDVREAELGDAGFIVGGNCAMAEETEGITLDRDVVRRGVEAILGDRSKGRYFVAVDGGGEGRAVGQLMVTYEWSDWRDGMIWWVQSVWVEPGWRRRGVFRGLYEHVRKLAAAEGAVGIRLYVEENNAAAQGTYRRMGMGMTHYRVMEEMFGAGRDRVHHEGTEGE